MTTFPGASAVRSPCYGNWDQKAVECVGGLQPVPDADGNYRRGACSDLSDCRNYTTRKLVPLSNLVRPTPPPTVTTPQQAPTMLRPPIPPQSSQLAHEVNALRTGMTQQYQHNPFAGMAHAPLPSPFQMPSYLTVNEPLLDHEPIWKPLIREILRAALKGLAHQIASFVDRTVFKSKGK